MVLYYFLPVSDMVLFISFLIYLLSPPLKVRVALMAQVVKKNLPARQETGFDPWVRKILAGGNGNSLQYYCLGNPMDRGAWWQIIHGVAKSWP